MKEASCEKYTKVKMRNRTAMHDYDEYWYNVN